MIALDLSLENLYRQYLACRRNKRNTLNALRFEAEQEKNLIALREALLDRSYWPRRSVCFFTGRPKLREIIAADFRDRVVHHLLVDYLERIWEPVFIHDSYACRRGKGVHKGVARLQQFIRQVTANGARPAWYLQLDIRNYFMSIDRDILFGLLAAKLRDETALWLTRMLVYQDVTDNCHFRGRADLLDRIPPHKTLFRGALGNGLPIGNLNSQFFANVYLNRLDQFVKHDLRCRHYLRYCDDVVLLSPDREQLVRWRDSIEAFLRDALKLELNPRQRLAPVSNGVDFLGYIVRRDYLLVRRRVVGHLKEKLKFFEARLVGSVRGMLCYRFNEQVLDQLAATLSSYLGHFKRASTWNLWRSVWRQFDFVSRYFAFDAQNWKLIRRYPAPKVFRRVREQYRYFRRRFPGAVLFFQVGRFMECYDIDVPDWVQWLGLRRMKRNRRGARYGFPVSQVEQHLRTLIGRGRDVLLIRECAEMANGIRLRAPVGWFLPDSTVGPATWNRGSGESHSRQSHGVLACGGRVQSGPPVKQEPVENREGAPPAASPEAAGILVL